jgi:uncharacterized SAM-binding protein YcdF (DUF218 family)
MPFLLKFSRILVGMILLAGVVTTLLLSWLAWRIDQAGGGDPVQPTDAIAILGAQVRADGSPGRDLSIRTRWAVALYHQMEQAGHSPVLITTGGYQNDRLSAAAVAQRLAQELGVPPERIVLADGGQSTGGDAAYTARRMAEHGWQSVTLVSHPLHLFRSRWHFERAGIEEVRTYAAGSKHRLPPVARLFLSGREAAGVLWGAIDGWERFETVGLILESIFYPRRT